MPLRALELHASTSCSTSSSRPWCSAWSGDCWASLCHRHHLRSGEDSDFRIRDRRDVLAMQQETSEVFTALLASIAGVSLLVGGIGIMNIMLVSVTECTREIGIRKAMGARRRDILFQFVSEATLLSLGGGGLGVILGLVLSRLLDGRDLIGQSFQTVFSLEIAILALIVSAVIGLFFGIYPAMRAARLHPIEALRYEIRRLFPLPRTP